MLTRQVAVLLAAAPLALAACGGGGGSEPDSARAERQGAAALKRTIETMKRKGTAAFTLSYRSEGVPAGQSGFRARGGGLIDLRHVRSRYRVHYVQAPQGRSGSEVDFFSDRSATFARPAGRGRYRRQRPSLVANGPADSLQYIATDGVGVRRTGTGTVAGRTCTRYAGRLDFARIRRRARPSRRAEFDRKSRGIRSLPFSVCIDAGGVLREYRVDIRAPGAGGAVLHLTSRFTRVGSAEPIGALAAADKA